MTNPITIRPPQKKDLHSLLNFINDLVAEDIFINVNQKQTLVQEKKYINNTLAKIKKNQQVVLLALHNKLLIGNCGITRDRYRSSSVGTLDISIKKEYRGQGIGKQLIQSALKKAKTKLKLKIVKLEVLSLNKKAITFYQQLGFKKFGELPESAVYKNKYINRIYMYKKL